MNAHNEGCGAAQIVCREQEIPVLKRNRAEFAAMRFSWLGRGRVAEPSEGCSPS